MTRMTAEAAATSAPTNRRDAELDERQLDEVNGGFQITKKTDASSPLLMLNCASGAH